MTTEEFESLLKKHKQQIYNAAYNLTQHKQEAEDLIQNTLEKLFLKIHKYDNRNFLGLVTTALRNRYLNDQKSIKRKVLTKTKENYAKNPPWKAFDVYSLDTKCYPFNELYYHCPSGFNYTSATKEEILDQLNDGPLLDAIRSLDSKIQDAFILVCAKNMRTTEAAKELNITLKTLLKRKNIAISKIREHIKGKSKCHTSIKKTEKDTENH